MFDRAGNLYFSDVHEGRVRRIDSKGTITTIARVTAAAGLSVDPTGRYLAIASIEGNVYRLRLSAGKLERLLIRLDGSHDVTYDRRGNLLIAGYGSVRQVGFLPSDVEPIEGGLLITQTKPMPAIRRLDTGSLTLTTLVR